MSNAIRISIPRDAIVPVASPPIVSKQANSQSDLTFSGRDLVVVALSSGMGLLISLILILRGVQAVWA